MSTWLSELALCHAAEVDGEQAPGSVVLTFNPAHPEGSHTLRMAVPAERSIAVLMCNLDQASNFDLIRNIRLDGKALGGTVKKLRWPTRWVVICSWMQAVVKVRAPAQHCCSVKNHFVARLSLLQHVGTSEPCLG